MYSMKTSIKYFLLYTLLSLISVSCAGIHAITPITKKLFYSNHEIIAKKGTKRDIAQAGILFPVIQSQQSLIYIPLFGMLDNRHSHEFNLGLGYRKLQNDKYILGGYGFFDYRKSHSGNKFKALTFGLELFTKSYEFRTNIYLPITPAIAYFTDIRDFNPHLKQAGHHTDIDWDRLSSKHSETANKGFDIEAGRTHKNILGAFLAYYTFFTEHEQTHGIRLRATYQVIPYVAIEAEANLDNKRKFIGYGGLKVNYPAKCKTTNPLITKMTALPIRDIDIKTSFHTQKDFKSKEHTRKVGRVYMIQPEHEHENCKCRDADELITILSSTGHKVTDIAVMRNKRLSFMSEFGSNVAPEGSIEFDILTKIEELERVTNGTLTHKYIAKNSSLYSFLMTGYWTDPALKQKCIDNIAKIKKLRNNVTLNTEQIKHFTRTGLPSFAINDALAWKLRHRSDVEILRFKGEETENPDNTETNKIRLRLAIRGLKNKNVRYLVCNFPMKDHASALIIDRNPNAPKVIFIESNGNMLSSSQHEILNSVLPPTTTYLDKFNPCRQRENRSCGVHTGENIVGYFNGTYEYGKTTVRRDLSDLFKEYMYSAYAHDPSKFSTVR